MDGMEGLEDEDDLRLVQASAGLLNDLQESLPKLLWKPSKSGTRHGPVHRQVKRRDLDHVINLIEPFQGDPQLLDTKLKFILPPIVEAYLQYISQPLSSRPLEHVDLQTAVCKILYVLCKVRGYKVIVGFLNNEPRYLEPVLDRMEASLAAKGDQSSEWQVQYILLLWLSHLMLTPFDLASISPARPPGDAAPIPILVERIQEAGVKLLSSSTKAQDAAATLLVRLVTRPDMLKLGLCTSLSPKLLRDMSPKLSSDSTNNIYELLGPLRFYAGIAMASADNRLGVVDIYKNCWKLSEESDSRLANNAVAKKLFVKIFRNTAITALRAASVQSKLTSMLETSGLIEDVIDYLLRSLGDRDTPVRYAAAKALSRLVLELEPALGHEIIQAVLDMFKEDTPRDAEALNFTTANALKWHGLTLTLAHMLFKRSAAPEQLPDIVNALVSALQFEQRTATGSSVGTNVRDAANFGLWALSRRYTTNELLSVDATFLQTALTKGEDHSIIQVLATNLVLSACLDPVGNIRRGSSAALQELVGRHPNQVSEGIALVQVVDYQAVGLRRRAMVDVASHAAALSGDQGSYWTALVDGLLGWRGVGSPDVPSREAAAGGIAALSHSSFEAITTLIKTVKTPLLRWQKAEELHGLTLSLTYLLLNTERRGFTKKVMERGEVGALLSMVDVYNILFLIAKGTKTFTARSIRSELSSAIARFLAALCTSLMGVGELADIPIPHIDLLTERLFTRYEDTIQQAIPDLAVALLNLKRRMEIHLTCIASKALSKQVAIDSSKSTFNGACGAVALGALAARYGDGLNGEGAEAAVWTLAALTDAMNVDWRVVGIKALRLAVEATAEDAAVDEELAGKLMNAVHRGMNDYTIDERGDVGSLVRLQAIACTSAIFAKLALLEQQELYELLQADIYRLCFEKLDRVRFEAAQCCSYHFDLEVKTGDVASVSSEEYFIRCLEPLTREEPEWKHRALLEGCISCAGISSESLLQASRAALVHTLGAVPTAQLTTLLAIFAVVLKTLLLDNSTNTMHPALELLSFLLDMQIPQCLTNTDFKWRNLLSTIQKSHHKSNDIPKILAAVHVYRGMADVPAVRAEVLKKLVSMLKTNPYPRVRLAVAEALWVVTGEEGLRGRDWMKGVKENGDVLRELEGRLVGG
ncbi:uncharacterized protein LTR77_009224 [Saxophila tyrrhenica]|uniref:Tubulin-specific chaperone D n=1 Tax=Saxophila tyrrhenica TaxID=1690608 RepID=A0AAV9P1W0_9PEZI|nr:hypothetical protein LTR77_009224 [Saxophila tyrrhenica]